MIELLKRSMNQRLAFAVLVLVLVSVMLAFTKLESGSYTAILIALLTAFYGEQAFDRWVSKLSEVGNAKRENVE